METKKSDSEALNKKWFRRKKKMIERLRNLPGYKDYNIQFNKKMQ
jgi:hypothetical protein